MMAAVDEDDATMLGELKERVARIKELERSLAVATRAPVEAASLIAQAQAVRARLDELRSALASNRAELRRDFYRRVLTGLTFRALATRSPFQDHSRRPPCERAPSRGTSAAFAYRGTTMWTRSSRSRSRS
jgi:hypothetical protein